MTTDTSERGLERRDMHNKHGRLKSGGDFFLRAAIGKTWFFLC